MFYIGNYRASNFKLAYILQESQFQLKDPVDLNDLSKV
jgi:hypothetical protein